MQVRDALHDRQAEPGTTAATLDAATRERFAQALPVRRIDAIAGVLDTQSA